MTLTRDDLIAYLRDDQQIVEDISGGTELFSSGILDSVAMVGLITFIEERASVTVQPADVTLENFDTIDSITSYLASLG